MDIIGSVTVDEHRDSIGTLWVLCTQVIDTMQENKAKVQQNPRD